MRIWCALVTRSPRDDDYAMTRSPFHRFSVPESATNIAELIDKVRPSLIYESLHIRSILASFPFSSRSPRTWVSQPVAIVSFLMDFCCVQ